MALLYLTPIDMGNNEIRNVLLQALGSDPSPLEALIYYNTTAHEVRYYNGTIWVSLNATGGGVTSVSGTPPIISSGGTTPAISISAATGSDPGSMSAADKAKLDAATASPSASTLALRDGSGRLQVATPSATNDATNKSYVDGLINGASWAPAVDVIQTTNRASLNGIGGSIDGYTTVAGTRVLLTGQTTGSENGVWVVSTGAWTRPVDYATGATIPPNRAYFVMRGTTYHDTGWTLTTDTAPVVDTDSTAWTQFTGLGEITAGNGLTKSGDVVSVQAADATITVASGGISVTNPKLKYSANIGDGSSTSITVNHALGTRDVQVQVYRNSSPWDTVICDVERTDTNNVALKFASAPASNAYRVVVIG